MTFDPILSACALFEGLSEAEISKALSCMSAREARCRRGQYLLHAGDPVRTPGVVLSGEVELFQEDFWGNRNLLTTVGAGEMFAEAFACAQALSPVSAAWIRRASCRERV